MTTMTFEPHLNLEHIVIVGAGGTGAQVARNVARILYDARVKQLRVPHLTLIDPDIVEAPNIGRQLFTPAHLKLPKATVIAQRLSFALGLDITSIVSPFNKALMPSHYGSGTILIGCVDNHVARLAIQEAAHAVLIDAGNHHNTAQCVIGNSDYDDPSFYQPDSLQTLRYLPSPYRVFPQLLEAEPEAGDDMSGLSCAQLVERSAQHLLINDLVSLSASNFVYKLLHRQPITHWMNFVSLDTLDVSSVPVSRETITHYGRLKSRKRRAA